MAFRVAGQTAPSEATAGWFDPGQLHRARRSRLRGPRASRRTGAIRPISRIARSLPRGDVTRSVSEPRGDYRASDLESVRQSVRSLVSDSPFSDPAGLRIGPVL